MPVLGLLVAVALVAANAFLIAVEFALARVRQTQVTEWQRLGRPGAAALRHGLEHIDAYLAASQLGITLASLSLGAVGEPAFHDLLAPVLGDQARGASIGLASGLAFAIITLMHVVAGELAPKSVSIARTERNALLAAPPHAALLPGDQAGGRPRMGNLLLKPFGRQRLVVHGRFAGLLTLPTAQHRRRAYAGPPPRLGHPRWRRGQG